MALIELTLENPAFKRTEQSDTPSTDPIEEPEESGGSSRAGMLVGAILVLVVVGAIARTVRKRRS